MNSRIFKTVLIIAVAFSFMQLTSYSVFASSEDVVSSQSVTYEAEEDVVSKSGDKHVMIEDTIVPAIMYVEYGWSLLNLFLVAVIFISGAVIIFDSKNKSIIVKIIAVTISIGSVVCIILTQDFSLPMTLIDENWLIFILLTICQMTIAYKNSAKNSESEKEIIFKLDN